MYQTLTRAASACLLAALTTAVFAQTATQAPPIAATTQPTDAEPAAPPRVVDTKSDELVRKMSDFLGKLKSYRVECETLYDDVDENTGQKLQFSRQSVVDLQRPNRLRIIARGEPADRRSYYDGKKVSILDEGANVYTQVDVPNTMDGMFDMMMTRYGVAVPLTDLLVSDVYDNLMGGVLTGRDLGSCRIGPFRCQHLAFTQKEVDWQLWIEEGAEPWPRRLTVTYKDLPMAPQYTVTLTKWDKDVALSDKDFEFTPPKDADKVEMEPIDAGANSTVEKKPVGTETK